jgi:hypothetical protein
MKLIQRREAFQYVKKRTQKCHKTDTVIRLRYLFCLHTIQFEGVTSRVQDNFLGCCEERVNYSKMQITRNGKSRDFPFERTGNSILWSKSD